MRFLSYIKSSQNPRSQIFGNARRGLILGRAKGATDAARAINLKISVVVAVYGPLPALKWLAGTVGAASCFSTSKGHFRPMITLLLRLQFGC